MGMWRPISHCHQLIAFQRPALRLRSLRLSPMGLLRKMGISSAMAGREILAMVKRSRKRKRKRKALRKLTPRITQINHRKLCVRKIGSICLDAPRSRLNSPNAERKRLWVHRDRRTFETTRHHSDGLSWGHYVDHRCISGESEGISLHQPRVSRACECSGANGAGGVE